MAGDDEEQTQHAGIQNRDLGSGGPVSIVERIADDEEQQQSFAEDFSQDEREGVS